MVVLAWKAITKDGTEVCLLRNDYHVSKADWDACMIIKHEDAVYYSVSDYRDFDIKSKLDKWAIGGFMLSFAILAASVFSVTGIYLLYTAQWLFYDAIIVGGSSVVISLVLVFRFIKSSDKKVLIVLPGADPYAMIIPTQTVAGHSLFLEVLSHFT